MKLYGKYVQTLADFSMHRSRIRAAADRYIYYKKSRVDCLEDVYTTYSKAKQHAYDYCLRLCAKYNGHEFRIISANTCSFSVGFEFEHPETGLLMFAYITKDYNSVTEVTPEMLKAAGVV